MTITVEKVDDFNTGSTTAPVQVVITGDKLEEIDIASKKLMALLKKRLKELLMLIGILKMENLR